MSQSAYPTFIGQRASMFSPPGVTMSGPGQNTILPWIPEQPRVHDPNGPLTLGMQFYSTVPLDLEEIHVWQDGSLAWQGRVACWDINGNLLSSSNDLTTGQAHGWRPAKLASPVHLAPGQHHVVGFFANTSTFAVTPQYFSPPNTIIRSGTFLWAHANAGRFIYAPDMAFPNQTFNGNNYWVDVVVVTK